MTDDRTIRFLFDYISPNAYIAWSELGPLAGRYGYRVDPVPVLFAGLLRANNARGPAEIRHKWQWMVHDVVRKCRRLELPLAPPASHPFNPLLALRVTSVDRAPADSRRVIDRLFRAVWAESEDVTSPPVVARLLDEVGIDGAATVLEAGTGEVKSRLRDRTEAAVSRGVFGVPTMLVGSALFWGYDDFPWLERHLGGEEVLDSSDLGGWGRVRPSARRRDAGGREIEPGRR